MKKLLKIALCFFALVLLLSMVSEIKGHENPTGANQNNTSSPNDQEKEISLFPNPATNFVNVQINNDFIGKLALHVINIIGNRIKNIEIDKTSTNFSYLILLDDIPAGIYFIDVVMGAKNQILKIQKN